MKVLLLFFIFFSFAFAQTCDFIQESKNNFFKNSKPELLSQDDLNLIAQCSDSLKNQKFTKELYKIANQIRGGNSACSGISYFPKLQNFNYLLLELAVDPIQYQKGLADSKSLEKKYDVLKSYFRYWAYQSIGNFRLYKDFWKEYNNAIEPLNQYYKSRFNFDEGSNIYYTTNALNEFLNWAVGETNVHKDISDFSKFISNQNYTSARLEDYIYTNNPSLADLTIALRAALLNQRDIDTLKILIKFGARIDEGYESAIFYALENYNNTKFLIEKGADVNFSNSFGKTPLFYAIEFGRKDIINLLLENGANVNQKYINNNEKLALSANIDSNTPYYITFCGLDHTSKNVLMHAAAYGDVEILKLLLAKGAKLNEVDDLGFNALDFALAAGKKENAAYLQSLGLKANENLFYGGSLE